MAKKKWFDKEASLDASEVILEEVPEAEVVAWSDVQETETFTEREQEPKDEPMETKVSAEPARTDELTQADIKWAKANLSGHPNSFDRASTELLERLCRYGIAADFGVEGYARGFKFHAI